jgi:hypothetical protein
MNFFSNSIGTDSFNLRRLTQSRRGGMRWAA